MISGGQLQAKGQRGLSLGARAPACLVPWDHQNGPAKSLIPGDYHPTGKVQTPELWPPGALEGITLTTIGEVGPITDFGGVFNS